MNHQIPENVVVESSPWTTRDLELLFLDEFVYFTKCTELPDLLVELGIYKSRSEARRAGRSGPISHGFIELKASKKKRLWIWNPSE